LATNVEQVLPPGVPIAIIRLDDLTEALQISRALQAGGITRLEFTLTNAHALEALAEVRRASGHSLVVGAGTILDSDMATASIEAGAQFLVTPTLVPDVITVANRKGIPVVCGAFTPTELLTAWRLGADLVKVFPAGVLGPGYIKDVLAPLPELKLVPTGGVNLETAPAFLAAGAYTIAIGSQLVGKEVVHKKDWAGLTELARRYMRACA
jgi:2-dehydro-3-deoxyphosphogluconate aldolase/(4S)-4-hydroxy-2-oxoglutarate aldolase